jgi:hypothetical protein
MIIADVIKLSKASADCLSTLFRLNRTPETDKRSIARYSIEKVRYSQRKTELSRVPVFDYLELALLSLKSKELL